MDDLDRRSAFALGMTSAAASALASGPAEAAQARGAAAGKEVAPEAMEHPMVCHMLEGQLEVTKDTQRFTAKKNDMWTCAIGTMEGDANKSRSVAIMRVVEFMA